MPASNAGHTQPPLNKLKAQWRVLRERVGATLPVRLSLVLLGIASIVYGQYLMEQRLPQGAPSLNAELWNITYRLDIPNYDNAYKALPYLIGGTFLCALMAMPSTWKNSFTNWILRLTPREGLRGQSITLVVGIISFTFLLILLGRHLYTPVYLLLWMISILAFTRVFWTSDKSAQTDLSLRLSYLDLFCMTGLLLLGFGVLSFALQDIPIAIIPDEDQFWQTARDIALRQTAPVIFDSGVFTFPIASSIYHRGRFGHHPTLPPGKGMVWTECCDCHVRSDDRKPLLPVVCTPGI
jgi:hypothetical protein